MVWPPVTAPAYRPGMDYRHSPTYRAAMKEIRRRSVAATSPGVEHGVPEGWDLPSGDEAEGRPGEG